MRKFIIASLILHAVVLLIFGLGISDPFQRTLKDQQHLLIDFVTISEKSAAPKLAPQQKIEPAKPKPEPEAKPEPETPPEPPEAEEPKPQEKKSPEPEKVEEPVKPESVPIKKKEPPKKKEEAKKPEPKEKPEKTKPEPKKSKSKNPKNNKAEVNLKKDKATPKPNKDKKKDSKTKKPAKAALDDLLKNVDKDADESEGEEGAPAQTIGNTVTASEIDALRQHMRKCWVVPAGIKGAKDMAVDIKMEVNKDGTVVKADIVDKARMARDGAFRTAAESAKRAVLDPQCNPLPLPPGKYDQWKNLEFSFNPKDMY